tara:strand:- start:15959 stop:16165 length:207 start_codon:yes stop_codon:yes gene_type:complete
MKYIIILIVLMSFTSCGILNDIPQDPDNECRCDYTTAYIDGQWWVLHPKKDCPPHNKRPEYPNGVLIL